MRILDPIVQALVRAMLDARHDLPRRGTVGSKLVGDHHTRRTALPTALRCCFQSDNALLQIASPRCLPISQVTLPE